MRQIEAGDLSPELAHELAESARDLLADDGGRFEDQPRRRQRFAHRLAVLELILDTVETFFLRHGIFLPEGTPLRRGNGKGKSRATLAGQGHPQPAFKIYIALLNSYQRAHEKLGLRASGSDADARIRCACGATFADVLAYGQHACTPRGDGRAPEDSADA
jgi:hypothetical protein